MGQIIVNKQQVEYVDDLTNRLYLAVSDYRMSYRKQKEKHGSLISIKYVCELYDVPIELFLKVGGAYYNKKTIKDAIIRYMEEVLDGQH